MGSSLEYTREAWVEALEKVTSPGFSSEDAGDGDPLVESLQMIESCWHPDEDLLEACIEILFDQNVLAFSVDTFENVLRSFVRSTTNCWIELVEEYVGKRYNMYCFPTLNGEDKYMEWYFDNVIPDYYRNPSDQVYVEIHSLFFWFDKGKW